MRPRCCAGCGARPPPDQPALRSLDTEARRWAEELPERFERLGRPFERAFDVASLLRDRRPELAGGPAPVRRMGCRLDHLSELLGLDRERMRRWAVVHALAWGMADDEWFPEIVACAGWLADA